VIGNIFHAIVATLKESQKDERPGVALYYFTIAYRFQARAIERPVAKSTSHHII